jgi:hypothetical protein
MNNKQQARVDAQIASGNYGSGKLGQIAQRRNGIIDNQAATGNYGTGAIGQAAQQRVAQQPQQPIQMTRPAPTPPPSQFARPMPQPMAQKAQPVAQQPRPVAPMYAQGVKDIAAQQGTWANQAMPEKPMGGIQMTPTGAPQAYNSQPSQEAIQAMGRHYGSPLYDQQQAAQQNQMEQQGERLGPMMGSYMQQKGAPRPMPAPTDQSMNQGISALQQKQSGYGYGG